MNGYQMMNWPVKTKEDLDREFEEIMSRDLFDEPSKQESFFAKILRLFRR